MGLAAKRHARVKTLSGGQQRRLDVAMALVGDPGLLFLDEPTTGFDPSARRDAWEVVANLATLGKAVLLTTHYMDEAQVLARQLAVIAAGRIVATGAPETIGGRDRAAATISFSLPAGVAADLPAPGANVQHTATDNDHVEVRSEKPSALASELSAWAARRGVELVGLSVSRPSLEDIYLQLTAEADKPA